MGGIIYEFYIQPMNAVYLEAIAMYVIWLMGMFLLRGRAKRIIAGIVLVFSVILILYDTILNRQSTGHELSLIPFISFENAKIQPELYRAMFMNLILFMPLGMSMPFVLPEKVRMKVLLTIGTGLLLSVAVETVQYVFRLGKCETDDVIVNTAGAVIGSSVYLIICLFRFVIRRNKQRS